MFQNQGLRPQWHGSRPGTPKKAPTLATSRKRSPRGAGPRKPITSPTRTKTGYGPAFSTRTGSTPTASPPTRKSAKWTRPKKSPPPSSHACNSQTARKPRLSSKTSPRPISCAGRFRKHHEWHKAAWPSCGKQSSRCGSPASKPSPTACNAGNANRPSAPTSKSSLCRSASLPRLSANPPKILVAPPQDRRGDYLGGIVAVVRLNVSLQVGKSLNRSLNKQLPLLSIADLAFPPVDRANRADYLSARSKSCTNYITRKLLGFVGSANRS